MSEDNDITNFLFAVIHRDDLAALIWEKLRPEMFDLRTFHLQHTLAERCYTFWREYKRTPGDVHIVDLLENELKRNDERGKWYVSFIQNARQGAPGLNIDYVKARLEKFVILWKMETAAEELGDALEARNMDLAIQKAWAIVNADTREESEHSPPEKSTE